MTPCEVVLVHRVEGAEAEQVSSPAVPSEDMSAMKAVPLGSKTRQMVRSVGSIAADVFRVFDSISGHPARLSGYKFVLTLYSDKACESVLYKVKGVVVDPTYATVAFAPTATQASLTGFFYYDVCVEDSNGSSQVLVSDSYVYKKLA